MMYREDYYTGEKIDESVLDLIVSKQRNGPLATVKTIFKKTYQRITGISTI